MDQSQTSARVGELGLGRPGWARWGCGLHCGGGRRATHGRAAGSMLSICETSAAASLPRCAGTGVLGVPVRTAEMSA
eukprot:scaffold455_cov116-Isochrysis_galbana.AAC.12